MLGTHHADQDVNATHCQEQAIGRLSEVELASVKAALIEVLDLGA